MIEVFFIILNEYRSVMVAKTWYGEKAYYKNVDL